MNFGRPRNLEKMNSLINLPLYIFFAVLPSFIWLNYYLRKDSHPEPKGLVLEVFLLGMLISLPAIFLEKGAINFLEGLNFPLFFKIFFGVALIEEFLKFLVVRIRVFESEELDEPIDAIVYMIISGLGFAGAENLFFLAPAGVKPLERIVEISFLRFIGATFLHALSCAILGFYIGLSFFRKKERVKLIFFGIFLATLLHAFYNFFIIEFGEKVGILSSALLIILAALFVSHCFQKIRE